MNSLSDQYPIVLTQAVLWGDMDAFDHVNNTVYFRYFEDVRIAFFDRLQILEHKDATGIGPILASTRCDFKLPLKYPDTVTLAGKATVTSAKKITMEYAVYSEAQQAVVASGEGLLVYYNYNEGRSCEIPATIASAIQDLSE